MKKVLIALSAVVALSLSVLAHADSANGSDSNQTSHANTEQACAFGAC